MDARDVTVINVRRGGGEISFLAPTPAGTAPPMDPTAWRGPFAAGELVAELRRMGLSDAAVQETLEHAAAWATTVTERRATDAELALLHRLTGR